MIDKLIAPVLEAAGKVVVQGAAALGKSVAEHIAKHGSKHLIGGGAAVADGEIYAVGESVAHYKEKSWTKLKINYNYGTQTFI